MLTKDSTGGPVLDPDLLFAPLGGETTIGLAVSGGADSLALMVLFARWQARASGPRAIVYTLDHGLRASARAECAMVEGVAKSLGLEARVLAWTGEKPQSGLQANARSARYRIIGQAMRADGASVLVTAHHLDDQAETILMRLAHGSGARGLAGMQPMAVVEGVRVFRPLLDVPKHSLEALVRDSGLEAVDDPSNADVRFERVRWRQILPDLSALGLTAGRLAGFASRMQRLDALASAVADRFWNDQVHLDAFGVLSIGSDALANAMAETRIRVLERALTLAGGGQAADLAGIEAVAARLADSGQKGAVTLMGAVFRPYEEKLIIYREGGRKGLESLKLAAGTASVWDRRFEIATETEAIVAPAKDLTRASATDLLGHAPDIPMAALGAAPLVTGPGGEFLALGTKCFAPTVQVRHVALT